MYETESIMVPYLNQQPVERWIEDGVAFGDRMEKQAREIGPAVAAPLCPGREGRHTMKLRTANSRAARRHRREQHGDADAQYQRALLRKMLRYGSTITFLDTPRTWTR